MTPITDEKQAAKNDVEQSEARESAPNESSAGNLDRVRDILFGGQMRDLDRRFAKVEERLSKETADLKEDVRKRLSALEEFARTETETLVQRITTEHNDRTESIAVVSRDLQTTSTAADKKIGVVNDQLSHAQRELRGQIRDVHQRLTDELREKMETVLARLNHEAEDLRTDKADRATIAALFNEMAMRLTHEPPATSEQE